MQRTTSEHFRAERDDLKEAAEQSHNVILDLTLDGKVRWVSPTWEAVVGTPIESVLGKSMADLLNDNSCVFSEAVEIMRKDDSRSKIIHFSIQTGLKSRLRPRRSRVLETVGDETVEIDDEMPYFLDLEAQGIMVFDRSSGEESHVSHQYLRCSFDTTNLA